MAVVLDPNQEECEARQSGALLLLLFTGWVLTSSPMICFVGYSTVTDLARFLGWSTSQPRRTAMW